MDIDYAALYRNRLIDERYFVARIASVIEQIQPGQDQPTLQVVVVLDHNDSNHDGTRLTAILHPTDKGQKYIDAFDAAFLVTPDNRSEAVGRWAVVYVYQTQYKGSSFSVVKFCKQTTAMMQHVSDIVPRCRMTSILLGPATQHSTPQETR